MIQRIKQVAVIAPLVSALLLASIVSELPSGEASPIQIPRNFEMLAPSTAHLFRTAGIIGADDRETYKEKALREGVSEEMLLKQFPIRQFYCGKVPGTASLVLRANILLMSAHTIFDENCRVKTGCFLNDYNGDQYDIDPSTLVTGLEILKARTGSCSLPKTAVTGTVPAEIKTFDWAIVKLRKKVRNATALGITIPTPKGRLKTNYTVVSALAKDIPKPKKTMMHFQTCKWQDGIYDAGRLLYMKMDCDGAQWMSGSPLLNEMREVEGILVRVTSLNSSSYNVDNAFSSAAPVSQEMISAIYKLAGEKPPSFPSQ